MHKTSNIDIDIDIIKENSMIANENKALLKSMGLDHII